MILKQLAKLHQGLSPACAHRRGRAKRSSGEGTTWTRYHAKSQSEQEWESAERLQKPMRVGKYLARCSGVANISLIVRIYHSAPNCETCSGICLPAAVPAAHAAGTAVPGPAPGWCSAWDAAVAAIPPLGETARTSTEAAWRSLLPAAAEMEFEKAQDCCLGSVSAWMLA